MTIVSGVVLKMSVTNGGGTIDETAVHSLGARKEPEKTNTKNDDDVEEGSLGKRKPKMTENYRHYRRDTLQTQLRTLHRRVKKQSNLINTLLNTTDTEALTTEVNNLDRIFQELSETNSEFLNCVDEEKGPSSEEVTENVNQEAWFAQVENEYFIVKTDVCEWLKKIDKQRSGSVRSGVSARSKHSSKVSSKYAASDKSLRQKAKIASLKAEVENLRIAKEAEFQAELSQLHLKIAKAEAEEKVFSGDVHNFDSRSAAHPEKPSNVTEIQQAMVSMMNLQRAPAVQLDTFSGNPLEYEYFKATFTEVVGKCIPDQKGRLTRLIQCTSGEPKELIKHLIHSVNGYDKAMKILDSEYGDVHLLTSSYLKEIRQWPAVKQNDAEALKKFHRFLVKCQAYKSGEKLRELDSPELIRILVLKLHTTYHERWNRLADKTRRKKHTEPGFDLFVEFISEEKSVLCNPTYSRIALLETNMKVNTVQFEDNPSVRTTTCASCWGHHDIEDCEAYLNMTLDDRHKYVFSHRLCFACLQPTEAGHTTKT